MKEILNRSKWAIHPDYLEANANKHVELTTELAEKFQAARRSTSFKNISGGIAVLPMRGEVFNRTSWESMVFGLSCEDFGQMFDSAIADPNIGAVIFDVDSPGGEVSGTPELAQKIFDARGTKPIIAVVNSMAASAGYWLASAADEIVVTPSGCVGSIGVFCVHLDASEALAEAGLNYTIIKAGKFKAENISTQPISEDNLQNTQTEVDAIYSHFISAVAKHRGTSSKDVLANFGEGRVVDTSAALKAGMIDKTGTLDQVILDLTKKKSSALALASKNASSKAKRVREIQIQRAVAQ